MTKIKFESVDDYIAAQPEQVQKVLERVRSTLRKALPKADEVISYQIPAYKTRDGTVIYFAGWKQHYSLYPITKPVVAAFKKDLAPHEVNNKGTARFPLTSPVPVKLIAGIARFRARQVAEDAKAKKKRK